MLITTGRLLSHFTKQKEEAPYIWTKAVHPSVYPFFCQYQKLSALWEFHKIPYKNRYKQLSSKPEFHKVVAHHKSA
jgi:hypothetical protein